MNAVKIDGQAGLRRGWTFLSNHAHVLIALARDPDLRIRELAATVGITERAVVQILGDLEAGGVIAKERHGRRNSYAINGAARLRHPVEARHTVADILALAIDPDA